MQILNVPPMRFLTLQSVKPAIIPTALSNFSIGKRYYSFDALEYLLMPLLNDCLGK